jgi:hypothetical protein
MRKRKQWTQGGPSFAFSVEEFATAYHIGRSSVFEEIKSGRLKARKVGNRTIITNQDADDWRQNLPLAVA